MFQKINNISCSLICGKYSGFPVSLFRLKSNNVLGGSVVLFGKNRVLKLSMVAKLVRAKVQFGTTDHASSVMLTFTKTTPIANEYSHHTSLTLAPVCWLMFHMAMASVACRYVDR